MSKTAVAEIIENLGDDLFCSTFGVGRSYIRSLKSQGVFPASMFDVLEGMCKLRGLDCPRSLFNFKPALVKDPRA
jgi:hypothetical protein